MAGVINLLRTELSTTVAASKIDKAEVRSSTSSQTHLEPEAD